MKNVAQLLIYDRLTMMKARSILPALLDDWMGGFAYPFPDVATLTDCL